jgi:hypothetical protein
MPNMQAGSMAGTAGGSRPDPNIPRLAPREAFRANLNYVTHDPQAALARTDDAASPLLYPAIAITLIALVQLISPAGPAVMGSPLAIGAGGLAVAALMSLWRPHWQTLFTAAGAHTAAFLIFRSLPTLDEPGLGFWALVVSTALTGFAFALSIAGLCRRIEERSTHPAFAGFARFCRWLLPPFAAGGWVLLIWEIVAIGLDLRSIQPPSLLLPALL